jgi:transketolase
MRNIFIDTLIELAEKDKDIYLLTGDLGFPNFFQFAEKFPDRFINCGVAEQNMVGVAAGLALEGKKPYVYSIAPFLSLRCTEQIRNDICYQNLNVKLIGAGEGFCYGELGSTHYATEDIGVLRALPEIMILSPADPNQLRELLLKSYQIEKPAYIRIARSGEKNLTESKLNLEIGKPLVLKQGSQGVIICTGTIVQKLAEAENYKLIYLHTIKPIDKKALLSEIGSFLKVVTVEEHNITGGLGSAVAEIIAESDWKGEFKRIGVPDKFADKVGSRDYFLKKYNINI